MFSVYRAAGLIGALAVSVMAQPQRESKREISQEVDRDAYFAAATADRNRGLVLPSLNYWGIDGISWGSAAPEVSKSRTPLASAAAVAAGQPTSALSKCAFAGLNCSLTLDFKKQPSAPAAPSVTTLPQPSSGLSEVRRSFAQGIKDRSVRLGMYMRLKAEIERSYGSPTHNIAAEDQVRGQDAYVQGLDAKYQVEWRGRETVASLVLSDNELALSLRPAATSTAPRQQQLLRQFESSGASVLRTPGR